MTRSVAILGATGLVGQTMLTLLEQRDFPCERVRLLASDRSAARRLRFRGGDVPVEAVTAAGFAGCEVALFASSNEVSRQWAPSARDAGACVIDNSSAFRYDEDVPLVVPEVNAHVLESRPTLIANPNCTTIPIAIALAALAPLARLVRVTFASYQSVSGAGADALAEFEQGIRDGLGGPPPPRAGDLPPFAYNVIPHIDRFEENGYTREEMKAVWEMRKILNQPDLLVSCTSVRVPVRIGHSAAVHAVFDRPVTPADARARWRDAAGVEVADDPARGIVPTPLAAAGRDAVLIGRARADLTEPCGLAFFVASDNLRKGAALNAVQIAEAWCGAGAGRR